ncbi:MAG: HAMP domain-containing histidine kinase [Chloroflexi bacterium]|nr:HAMP domain-containing histidine kinase [Chloroflexota bacterium]
MSRSIRQARAGPRAVRIPPVWLERLLPAGLVAAVVVGVVASRALLPMSGREIADLVVLLGVAGAVSTAVGLLVLRWISRAGVPLVARAFIAGSMGAVAALANVLVVASFMFVNTAHDLRLLLAVSLAAGSVAAVVSALGALDTTRRVRALAGEVRALASGASAEEPDSGSGDARGAEDEVSELAGAVDDLRLALGRAERRRAEVERERTELTTALSHDLRTPLAAIRVAVDALDDGVVSEPSEVARYHALVRREVDRLARLIDDLFELARIEAGAARELSRLELEEIASDVADGMTPLAERAGVRLLLLADPGLPALPLDGTLIERAIGNLLRNAIQHATPDSVIELRLQDAGGGVGVTVRNEGVPIAEGALPHIWERFYRAERARDQQSRADADGSGLGLTIVRAIAERHGGEVTASSSAAGGTVLGFTLPPA